MVEQAVLRPSAVCLVSLGALAVPLVIETRLGSLDRYCHRPQAFPQSREAVMDPGGQWLVHRGDAEAPSLDDPRGRRVERGGGGDESRIW